MILLATTGSLLTTGVSYVSAMSTIASQRSAISSMWKRIHELLDALASSGRKLSLFPGEDPVAKGNRRGAGGGEFLMMGKREKYLSPFFPHGL